MEELQKQIDRIMNEINNEGLPEFEGYSPTEMQYILHHAFQNKSPIQLQELAESDYKKIPIFNQVKYLLELVEKHGTIKLTQKGFLPTKIVGEIYNQGFIKNKYVEFRPLKYHKEADILAVSLAKALLNLSGLIKKRNNKLTLTKKGNSIIGNDNKLLLLIINTFCNKFNWAYYDGYGQNNIGQLGFGFSLILLSKYGATKRLDSFYSEKYYKAFPKLIDGDSKEYFDLTYREERTCYSLRTFDRFMDFFGLIKIDCEKDWDADKFITKTELFDKFIKCLPHSTKYEDNNIK